MTSSQPTQLLSELAQKSLSDGNLAYLTARAQNKFHDYVLRKFRAAEESEGLTKAELARRIGKRPELITRILGASGNWTIDTVARLLAGISGEELIPASEALLGRSAQRNYKQADMIGPTVSTSSGAVVIPIRLSNQGNQAVPASRTSGLGTVLAQ